MKTAMILSGSLNSIIKQSEELNSYISRYFSSGYEIEAWIISNEDIDLKAIIISSYISSIKLVKVRTNHIAEEFLEVITQVYKLSKPKIMIFGSEAFASSLSVRAAYRLKGTSCVGVRSSQYYEGHFAIQKLVYSNNLTAKFIMKDMPYCISIAKGFKDDIEIPSSNPAVEKIIFTSLINTDWCKSYKIDLIEKADGLSTAKIVVVVGKGIGSKDKIDLIEEFTKLLGGKLGASRPVVMNAWTKMNNLIGASGSIISPDICIVIGVSGSAAFTVGIEKSKFIIAINKDEGAPIFKIADVAICSLYQEVVCQLIKLLKLE